MSEIFNQVVRILQKEVGFESLEALGIDVVEQAGAIVAPEVVIPALLAFGIAEGLSSGSIQKIKDLHAEAKRNAVPVDKLTKSRAELVGSKLGQHVRGRLEAGGGFMLKDPGIRARQPVIDDGGPIRPAPVTGRGIPARTPAPIPTPMPVRVPTGREHQIRKRQRYKLPPPPPPFEAGPDVEEVKQPPETKQPTTPTPVPAPRPYNPVVYGRGHPLRKRVPYGGPTPAPAPTAVPSAAGSLAGKTLEEIEAIGASILDTVRQRTTARADPSEGKGEDEPLLINRQPTAPQRPRISPLERAILAGAGLSVASAADLGLMNVIKKLLKERRTPGAITEEIKLKLKERKTNEEVAQVINDILNPTTIQSLHNNEGKQKIQYRDVFKLPSDTESYTYVELVRLANASNQYQQNLFNTSF